MMGTTNNAITQRLEILQSHYRKFRENPEARFCHWAIKEDEAKMMEAFVKYENSEHGIFPDLFFPVISPFKSASQYSQSLLEETNSWLDNDTASIKEAGYDLQFDKPARAEKPSSFLEPLSRFASRIKELDNVVAVLEPTEISDYGAWESWMMELAGSNIPLNTRIMVSLEESASGLYRLRGTYKNIIVSILADLDMPGAMRQLASSGDPGDPGVQYRLLILDMGQAASEGNFDKMKSFGEKAVNLAQQQVGWEHLEVAAYLTLGSFIVASNQKEAVELYKKGVQTAENAHQNKHPLGVPTLLQAHNFIAAAYFGPRQYEEAIHYYGKAAAVAKTDKNYTYQQMEAHRMSGLCFQQLKRPTEAFQQYWQALDLATEICDKFQTEAVFLHIGAGAVEAMRQNGDFSQKSLLGEKMTKLAGEDWEQKIESQKIKP